MNQFCITSYRDRRTTRVCNVYTYLTKPVLAAFNKKKKNTVHRRVPKMTRQFIKSCKISLCNNKVQVGKDQEKAQSEKDSHSKTEVGKNQTNNQVLIP